MLSDLKAAWRLCGASIGAGWIAAATALILLAGASDGAALALLVPLLNRLGAGTPALSGTMAGVLRFLPASLGGLLLVFVAVAIVRAIVSLAREVVVARIRFQFSVALRVRVYAAIANASWSHLRRRRAADFQAVFSSDIDRLDHGAYLLLELPARLAIVIAHLAVAAVIAPGFSALAVAFGLALAWGLRRHLRESRRIGEAISDATTRVAREITDFLQALKLTKSYGAETRHIHAFAAAVTDAEGAHLSGTRLMARSQLVADCAIAICLAGFLWLGSGWAGLPLANLLVLILVFQRLMPMFQNLQNLAQQLVQYAPALRTVAATVEGCEAAADRSDATLPREMPFARNVRFEKVSFGHDPASGDVLREVDLSLPAGSFTVVSGASGAGKSTFLDLIGGLIEPTQGRILIDDAELTPALAPSWRRSIGYMAQEAFLFHDTIRANLIWAAPDASDEMLRDTIDRVGLGELLRSLPKDLDTIVGDRGANLSGGERQRLALARALLRKPQLLLLDEPASALDAANERHVLDLIQGLRGTVTIVLVTHRPSSVAGADRHITLGGGRPSAPDALAE
jgi:ATP-binding cassette, subfamily C, bacterial